MTAIAEPATAPRVAALIGRAPGLSNAAVARLISGGRTLARSPNDADQKRIDDKIQMHSDLADPDFINEMLMGAKDEDEAELWIELLEDPTKRAYHWRVVLLLENAKASSTAEVDKLLATVEATAKDEAATLQGAKSSALNDEAWAFPHTWSQKVASTLHAPAGLDLPSTAKAATEATDKAAKSAGKIPDDVLARGLPVSFERALDLKSFPFRFDLAKLPGNHAVKAYAIDAKEMAAARLTDGLARGWANGKQTLVNGIAAGHKVVDTKSWARFAAPRRYQPNLKTLSDEAVSQDVSIIDTLEAEEVDVGRHELALAKLTSILAIPKQLEVNRHAEILFNEAMARADAQIAKASGDRRLDLADAWADALGYPAAARKLLIQALKDNAGDIALDTAKDIGIGMIPVIGWIWRGKEIVEEIGDLIKAGKDLVDARDVVERAASVIALQRAAARLSLQENASAATFGMAVTGGLPAKKGKATGGGTQPSTGGGAKPGGAGSGTKPGAKKGPQKPDPKSKDTDPVGTPGKGGKPDVAVRIERKLPQGGTLKLLENGRFVLCHSPCTYLEHRYARELDSDPSGLRRAWLAALAKREQEAVRTGDKVEEEEVFDAAMKIEEQLRKERRQYLGTDKSATGGRFREHEATQGEHIEQHLGRPIEVLDPNIPAHKKILDTKAGDWLDPATRETWDGLGGYTPPVPKSGTGTGFDFTAFKKSIDEHVIKRGLDHVMVDISGFAEADRQQVINYIKSTYKDHTGNKKRPFLRIFVDNTRGVI